MKKCPPGKYYCTDRKKCMPIPRGYYVGRGGWLEKDKKNGNGNGQTNGNGSSNGNGSNNGNGNGNGGNGGGVSEAVTISRQTGNVYHVLFSWRGKMIGLKLFFPQIRKPKRKEMQAAIQKVYPGSQLRSFYPSDHQPGDPFLNVGK